MCKKNGKQVKKTDDDEEENIYIVERLSEVTQIR